MFLIYIYITRNKTQTNLSNVNLSFLKAKTTTLLGTKIIYDIERKSTTEDLRVSALV